MVIVLLLASVTVMLVGADVGTGVVFGVEGFFVGDTVSAGDAVTVDAEDVGNGFTVGAGPIVGESESDAAKYAL